MNELPKPMTNLEALNALTHFDPRRRMSLSRGRIGYATPSGGATWWRSRRG